MKNFIGAEKFLSRMFRPVENVVWDLSTGRVGLTTENGIATLSGEGANATVEINMFDQFGIGIPAFAQSTPIQDVKPGDLVFTGKGATAGWVIECKQVGDPPTTKFNLMKVDGTTTLWTVPKVQMLGMADNGVLVLRSLTSILPGGDKGLTGMQNNLQMMMQMTMFSGGELDLESIIPMMLMGQSSGDSGNMMQMVMMMNMMQGKGTKTANPFQNMMKSTNPPGLR